MNLIPAIVVAGALSAIFATPSFTQGEKPMSRIAKGTFTVELKPEGEKDSAQGVDLGRMSLAKVFEGDLAGTSAGTMLTAMTPVEGSAAYVAIERLVGTLGGKKGSFVFQHMGTMNRGEQSLSITVVPDSGTGELAGIAGVFRLRIEDGKHFYEFEYTLP